MLKFIKHEDDEVDWDPKRRYGEKASLIEESKEESSSEESGTRSLNRSLSKRGSKESSAIQDVDKIIEEEFYL